MQIRGNIAVEGLHNLEKGVDVVLLFGVGGLRVLENRLELLL